MRGPGRVCYVGAMSEPEVPEQVVELVEACLAAVQNSVGVELDFTQDTLPLLDHYARDSGAGDAGVRDLVGPLCGAYFGEVVRRELGDARWHIVDDMSKWRLEFERVYLCFNPIGVALEAVSKVPEAGYHAHLSMLDEDEAMVKASLERLGDVGTADYFSFGVRYEVVELAHSALTARKSQLAEAPAFFGPEVYAAAAKAEEE